MSMARWETLCLGFRTRAAKGWVLVFVLGVLALVANLPEAPLAPSEESFPEDPNLVTVSFPPPVEIPGDRGDIRAARGPMQVAMTRQLETSPFRFTEIAKEAGIDFVHVSGMTRDKHFPTANGSGVGLFDYDNDGLLDIYLCSGTFLPVGSSTDGKNRLYKNLGNNRFRDVTDESGLGFHGFCHGVVAGDVDNDGDQDVFLCNYGSNRLYLNDGTGRFHDVSQAAGIDRPGWSSGGAFIDYDNDGDLDLYVANYGEWIYPDDDHSCGDINRNARTYCSPKHIRTVPHFFYSNNGDGTFTEVYAKVIRPSDPSSPSAEPRADGRGFGVVTADINNDGKIDIFVANDMSPNFVFLNRGDGTFDDATDISGAGYDAQGHVQSGMGADAEDLDGDGLLELYISNFEGQYNTVYRNLGGGRFVDATRDFGLAHDTLPWVGWGAAWVDLDNDGLPDNFVANGHVDDNLRLLSKPVDYAEPPILYANLGENRFRLATRDAGPYFETQQVGRGAAFGDIDNDGDIDIVVNHKDGPPALLRNDTLTENRWIRFELQGTRSNRDGIGARLEITAGERVIHRRRKGGVSMESANDPRVLIGIGRANKVTKATIHWPSGTVTQLENLKAEQTYKIKEEDQHE